MDVWGVPSVELGEEMEWWVMLFLYRKSTWYGKWPAWIWFFVIWDMGMEVSEWSKILSMCFLVAFIPWFVWWCGLFRHCTKLSSIRVSMWNHWSFAMCVDNADDSIYIIYINCIYIIYIIYIVYILCILYILYIVSCKSSRCHSHSHPHVQRHQKSSISYPCDWIFIPTPWRNDPCNMTIHEVLQSQRWCEQRPEKVVGSCGLNVCFKNKQQKLQELQCI